MTGDGPATNTAPTIEIGGDLRHEAEDAILLLDFALSSGFKAEDGRTIGEAVIAPILAMAASLGIGRSALRSHAESIGYIQRFIQLCRDFLRPRPAAAQNATTEAPIVHVPIADWTQFLLAYHQLAQLLQPISAQTLRNTGPCREKLFLLFTCDQGRAVCFARKLWILAFLFATFNICVAWGSHYWGPPISQLAQLKLLSFPVVEPPAAGWWPPMQANTLMQLLEILVPFSYGGLGACVYLLRSAHSLVHERKFDVRRKPEYYSRIVLGMIGGGAILLFVNNIVGGDGKGIMLSSAALGFLAGYSTDFLFQTVERVVAAILPKVGLESVQRAPASPLPAPPMPTPVDLKTGNVTLETLIAKFEATQDANARALYKSLIEKIRDRI